jgi:hypothetical protein
MWRVNLREKVISMPGYGMSGAAGQTSSSCRDAAGVQPLAGLILPQSFDSHLPCASVDICSGLPLTWLVVVIFME